MMINPLFGGIKYTPKIFVHESCLSDSKIRNFKKSKHRSNRVYKKLIKRFGSEFKKEPAIFRQGNDIFCHPIFEHQIRGQI